MALPDPGKARSLDDLVERLQLLKVWAGDPSYEWIKDRVNAAWAAAGRPAAELAGKTTVVDCFRPGRRRLNTDLVVAVVAALQPDLGYVTQWRQALQVIGGRVRAAAQVRVQDKVPPDLSGFTGRGVELDRLHRALRDGASGGDGVVISGMAGVGKTKLAIHAAHLLAHDHPFEQVLFVDLRGFHPDLSQPPAEPAAVLEGFLRLLGVPGQQIPHDLSARAAAYRARLAGTRTLVLLDNAADAAQVRPLLPAARCPVLITSRRSLAELRQATHVAVDVFARDEALDFLGRSVPGFAVGTDPEAAARVAHRCGYLPLALSLVTAHMRAKPGWTLTDHATRLDERHEQLRLDSGVELALDLSYRDLPGDRQRLLRQATLHPGQDLDAYGAAALAGTDLLTAQAQLDDLYRDHLLQLAAPGRYTLHDLVRVHAGTRATDDDSPGDRRGALTRLFDYYLATTAAAMDTLHPAEAIRRPRVTPAATPAPVLSDPDTAIAWLDTERPTLVAVVAHTATHGWPDHATRLATTLYRYLTGGHYTDALTVHGHARDAARHTGDSTAHAVALTNLGVSHSMSGRHDLAAENFEQALHLFRQNDDPVGQARALTNLGVAKFTLGPYRSAADDFERALSLFRQAGDPTGEAHTLGNLGELEAQLGREDAAAEYLDRALHLFRQAGDRTGEAWVLTNLGEAELRSGRLGPAEDHLRQAMYLYRQLANRVGETSALNSLGSLHTCLGRHTLAIEHHQQALTAFRETGDRDGEARALNGLGEAAHADGRPADALEHHTAALTIAVGTGDRSPQARAHTGLGHAHRGLAEPGQARRHYEQALTLYTDLGTPEADQIRAHLAAIDDLSRKPR